jgi:hypothetical protein
MSRFGAQVLANSINVIAVYDSPQCAPLVNYNSMTQGLTLAESNAYERLYKLVPYDASLSDTNYDSLVDTLTRAIQANLTNQFTVCPFSYFSFQLILYLMFASFKFKVSNALDELEDYYFLDAYDSSSPVTYLNGMNGSSGVVTLKCYVDANANLENYRFCYRSLNFKLFGYTTNATAYKQVATLMLGDLTTYNATLSVSISMPNNYTFAVVSPSSAFSSKNKSSDRNYFGG